jgi:hypothetical protein
MSEQYRLKTRWLSSPPAPRCDVIDVKHGAPEHSLDFADAPRELLCPAGRRHDIPDALDATDRQQGEFLKRPVGVEGDRPVPLDGPFPESPWESKRARVAASVGVDDPRNEAGSTSRAFSALGRVWRALVGR